MIPRAKRRALVADWVRRRNPAQAERKRQQDLGIQGGMVKMGHLSQRRVYLPYPPRRHATAAKPIPTLP